MRHGGKIESRQRPRPCENEGCVRKAASDERFCETCGIERSLFRRDERPAVSARVR